MHRCHWIGQRSAQGTSAKGPLFISGCPSYRQKMPWWFTVLFTFPQHRQTAKYQPRTTLFHGKVHGKVHGQVFILNLRIKSDGKIHDTVEKHVFQFLKKEYAIYRHPKSVMMMQLVILSHCLLQIRSKKKFYTLCWAISTVSNSELGFIIYSVKTCLAYRYTLFSLIL